MKRMGCGPANGVWRHYVETIIIDGKISKL